MPIDANPINAGATAGTAKDASTAANPPAQTTGNSGAAATLASGATTGTCENSDAASGAAARLEAAVSESASRARRGARWKHCAIHAWKSPANSTMPSVESADSANETASAVRGSSAMQPIMHTASALSAAGRRRAVNANMPANAMTAARTADEGAAASTRKPSRNDACRTAPARRGTRSARKSAAAQPATMDRCAPDTATRCASPLVW